MEGYVVGTPDYLAPEQALDSHGVDIRADMYSLGCTFYELLTGKTPFAAVTGGTQKLISHLQETPPPLENLRSRHVGGDRGHRAQNDGQTAARPLPNARPSGGRPRLFRPARTGRAGPQSAFRILRDAFAAGRQVGRWHGGLLSQPSDAVENAGGLYEDKPKELPGHQGTVHGVAFSPDGRFAVSVGEDHAVILWDVLGARKKRHLQGHIAAVRCVAYAADGRTFISGGNDRALILWDADSGQQLARLTGPSTEIAAAALSPDGKLLLTGGNDQALHLWDLTTRRYVRQLGGVVRGRHYDAISGVAFAPDGGRAVSVSLDKTLRLWNIATGREVQCYEGHTDKVYCVAFASDGIHVATAGAGPRGAVVGHGQRPRDSAV